MEQLVMVLVFALAAALCVQVFVLSDQTSRRYEARDRAVLEAQNAAELLKSSTGDMAERETEAARQLGGNYEQGILRVDYNENWEPVTEGDGAYRLTVQGEAAEVPELSMAVVRVTSGGALENEPEVLFELEVAWQEVDSRG
jgi:hypothetical protein